MEFTIGQPVRYRGQIEAYHDLVGKIVGFTPNGHIEVEFPGHMPVACAAVNLRHMAGLSFADWQEARTACADTGLQDGDDASGMGGYVYPGNCLITYIGDDEYVLTIANLQWGGEDLERLERILWTTHYIAEYPLVMSSVDVVAFANGYCSSRNLDDVPDGLVDAILGGFSPGEGVESTIAAEIADKFFSLKFHRTPRGFLFTKFTDRYDVECSLQASSLATESCIWFGPTKDDPKRLVPGKGWEPFELPENVSVNRRMHLTQQMVRDLLPALQHFAETGDLPE